MGPNLWLVLAGILCLAAGSLFALAESSLFSLSKWQARQQAERPGFAGTLLKRLLDQPSRLITVLVLGSTAAQLGLALTVFWPGLSRVWSPLASIAGLLMLFLLMEVAVKQAGVHHPEKWPLRLAPLLAIYSKAITIVAWPFELLALWLVRVVVPTSVRPQIGLSDDEYKELLELAHEQGAIARSERDIILRIISLDRKTAGDVMKPRTQIAAISDDASIEEMIVAARKHKYRRLPIYDETLDTIVGILNTRKLLLDPGVDLSEAIEFPSNVPETMNLLLLLRSLQRQQRGLAIVLDEFGGTAGLVTVEDILEEVVGDIRDRDEPAEFIIEKLQDGRWKLSGTTPIEAFRLEYPDIGTVSGVETMGGLVVKLFESVPAAGQSITFRGIL